jgi:hypothetical protein
MSDTDSFIEEVTEEVRRDRLFALYRKYGWIAISAVVLLVGGVAYNEYRSAKETAVAQALGDGVIAAQNSETAQQRAASLAALTPAKAGGVAITALLQADALAESGDTAQAIDVLNSVANSDAAAIYRDIAMFKAQLMQGDAATATDRRAAYQALAAPGRPLRLLAEEQLALIDLAEGDADAAIARLQAILQDAEAAGDVIQRAQQLIVALGGTPELLDLSQG